MSAVRIVAYGPGALLAEYDSLAIVMAVDARLRAARPAGVIDVIPAARTVVVTHDGSSGDVLRALLADTTPALLPPGPLVEIAVRYDGEDLDAVAASCGVPIDELVRRHLDGEYAVAFCGFMPGFAYLAGLDPSLSLPRRSTPRTRVPAGSVAIANEFCAIYPGVSPGGWHLLGTTDAILWDESRVDPSLLVPGTRVRFVHR